MIGNTSNVFLHRKFIIANTLVHVTKHICMKSALKNISIKSIKNKLTVYKKNVRIY